jgi:hypothetical protein
MALSQAQLARLDALLAALGEGADAGALDAGIAGLLPGVGRRHCEASDVLEEPYRSLPSADIHLLDAAGHCIRVTADPVEATALLIAQKACAPRCMAVMS